MNAALAALRCGVATRWADLQVLWHLVAGAPRDGDLADRLNRFYGAQAQGYDRFRARLLHGREALLARLPLRAGDVVVDLGGGTGANVALLSPHTRQALGHWYIVDLADTLLGIARQRISAGAWHNVSAVTGDACHWSLPRAAPAPGDHALTPNAGAEPAPGNADLVLFSYSLTMMPDWIGALDNALRLLRPGGHIAVVDFYVARKHPDPHRARHGAWTRGFWPLWFSRDDVFLNQDHLPYLEKRLLTECLIEQTGTVPYLPSLRVPYYVFVGRRR